jgi:uncharacterized protein (DUF2249 family)
MTITPTETVGAVAQQSGQAREALHALGLDTCCGARLTLTEAAAAAGLPLPMLMARLTLRPVEVDVRGDLARGVEPFARIMDAVARLGDDEALVLRAPFEPKPLYGVLGKRGFEHWAESRDPRDWSVWFWRPREVTLDVRGLEPPRPMVTVLEGLDTLRAGETLVVVHDRRPVFLYPQLDERGFTHETDETEPGVVRIRIRRA